MTAGTRVELLPPSGFRRTPWKNGGGVTVDVADAYRPGSGADGWSGMLWRFGHTRIERNGPFSDLTGYDRIFAVIDGGGVVLRPQQAPPIDVARAFEPVRFPGEWAIVTELRDGPVAVLNLMAERAAFDIDMSFVRGPTSIVAASGLVLIYAVAEAVELRAGDARHSVPFDHALRIHPGADFTATLDAGMVAVATIKPKTLTAN